MWMTILIYYLYANDLNGLLLFTDLIKLQSKKWIVTRFEVEKQEYNFGIRMWDMITKNWIYLSENI